VPNRPRKTTANVKQGVFRAHGLVEVLIDGDVARYEAWGPFNEELVAAYIAIQEKVIPQMVARSCWGDLSIFHVSMLASPSTLAKFAEDLKACALQGLAPNATAFVISPEVEGGPLMGPLFTKLYLDAELPFMIFSEVTEAEAWLQSTLAVANLEIRKDAT